MRNTFIIFSVLMMLAGSIFAQSGRIGPAQQTPVSAEVGALKEKTAEELFDEANMYSKNKFAEFEEAKIPFSDKLFEQTRREQRQLAAKYAALLAAEGESLAGSDFYFLGMLHWLAENAGGASAAFQIFLTTEDRHPEKAQTARSVIVVDSAKNKDFEKSEMYLADYLTSEPVRQSELATMENELAVGYLDDRQFSAAARHAERSYAATREIFFKLASPVEALNRLLDAGIVVFEIYRDAGQQAAAEKALVDLRTEAGRVGSTKVYYHAANEHIKYLIEIGHKPDALKLFRELIDRASKDFKTKPLQEDIVRRLKRRESQYRLLGELAPELVDIGPAPVAPLPPGGQPVVEPGTLSKLRGKVVLIDFWATWCAPCIDAFPALIEWHETFNQDGLEILGLTRLYGEIGSQTADQATEIEFLKKFKEDQHLPYQMLIAGSDLNQRIYGARSIPTAVVIDRKGVIRYIETGTSASREEEIRRIIVKLLAEK